MTSPAPTFGNQTPVHQHDCDQCTFLGNLKGEHGTMFDLYHCTKQISEPTIIARYGTHGDYASGMVFGWSSDDRGDPLVEARFRAMHLGLDCRKEHYRPELKTMDEWAAERGQFIADPDGFDRNDPNLETKLMSKAEFEKGYIGSTVGPRTHLKDPERHLKVKALREQNKPFIEAIDAAAQPAPTGWESVDTRNEDQVKADERPTFKDGDLIEVTKDWVKMPQPGDVLIYKGPSYDTDTQHRVVWQNPPEGDERGFLFDTDKLHKHFKRAQPKCVQPYTIPAFVNYVHHDLVEIERFEDVEFKIGQVVRYRLYDRQDWGKAKVMGWLAVPRGGGTSISLDIIEMPSPSFKGVPTTLNEWLKKYPDVKQTAWGWTGDNTPYHTYEMPTVTQQEIDEAHNLTDQRCVAYVGKTLRFEPHGNKQPAAAESAEVANKAQLIIARLETVVHGAISFVASANYPERARAARKSVNKAFEAARKGDVKGIVFDPER